MIEKLWCIIVQFKTCTWNFFIRKNMLALSFRKLAWSKAKTGIPKIPLPTSLSKRRTLPRLDLCIFSPFAARRVSFCRHQCQWLPAGSSSPLSLCPSPRSTRLSWPRCLSTAGSCWTLPPWFPHRPLASHSTQSPTHLFAPETRKHR